MSDVTKLQEKYDLHKTYCDKLNEIYIAKNTDYDDSFAKGIDCMGYMSAIVRMEDKMNRIKTLLTAQNKAMVRDETVGDTLLDLANYTLMLFVEYELRKDDTSESL